MLEIVKVIQDIQKAKTPTEKKFLLMDNKNSFLLQKILRYTYDPYKRYGITDKTFKNYQPNGEPNKEDSLYSLLDELCDSNINDELRYKFINFVKFIPSKDVQKIVKMIAMKDLKLGVSATTINKVWPGLIPSFEVQLAKSYKDVKLDKDELIFITEKFDGIRCVAFVENGKIRLRTRQGKDITGLIDIEKDLLSIKNLISMFPDGFVLDGELIFAGKAKDSGDRYRKTTKIVNSKMENKVDITFNVFDIMTIKEFKDGESLDIYCYRRYILDIMPDLDTVKAAPLLYTGTDHSKIMEVLNIIINQNKEGCMINRNKIYECKRTKNLLKVKKMNDADLKVIGYEEGRGENEGLLGALIVAYKGNTVNVGSGYTKEERARIWNKKDDMIGKIIKVQYFEETQNKNGWFSLRFPVFLEVRDDKTEPSYN